MSLWARTHEKEIVDTFKNRIETALTQLKQQLNTQKEKLDSNAQQTQFKTEELNKFYSNLNDFYRKWEGIKMLESSISQYKGVLENYRKKSLVSEGDSSLGR
ncbi:hypothetical protein [Candidatus Mycoplasma haematominutum]|uniref:Uncharacterized protein n=1 Tax=Candidatus Mycoplasma haematominutum 'Birmingham 1' TaxID=1116213 RepID=G8C3G3_9MOLU|nr:hypothetical protein [Candidatus Mycoplasma haematominutum]CCE66861.1 hypothetical protein MHM_03430 [Candidatus Mycoplasma haematominutum 'Birmingham 1']